MANMKKDLTDDVDVDAEARLRTVTLGMKQQADELLVAGQLDKALQLYRELLMHLTRSQVTLLREKELVISCRMNVLAALSKVHKWVHVVTEGTEALAVFAELREAQERQGTSPEEEIEQQVLSRAYYFRGFAYMRLGSFTQAQQDFHRAMELNPEDEAIQDDWKELQTAVQAEQKVKQYLATSMKFFQAGKYQPAVEVCMNALRESQMLKKTELTALIHGNLAAIYVKAKDDAKAIEHYKRTMLLTRGGANPTTPQNERVYDILDSMAGCYSRKRDYSSALSVIEDQIKLFPLCPERKDREAMMYLNGGRICYTMGKFSQAEELLEYGYSAAQKTSSQVDVTLNCAYWLSKAYAKNGETAEAMKTLDSAIPVAEKEVENGVCAELLDKLLVVRLDILDPDSTVGISGSSLFAGPLREAQLWRTLEYFDEKRLICGHLRAAEAIVNFLRAKGDMEDAATRKKVLRALELVDRVNIGKLASSEATTFMKLALAKVDVMARFNSAGRQESKVLLVKMLRELKLPGCVDPSCRQQLQAVALLTLVDICNADKDEESDKEVRTYLEEAAMVLRDSQTKDDPVTIARLRVLLPKIGRWKAARGDIVGAEEALEESAELLRSDSDISSDRLGEALIGLCVVQIRLGMLKEATAVMNEIEKLPTDVQFKELSVIKDRFGAVALLDALEECTNGVKSEADVKTESSEDTQMKIEDHEEKFNVKTETEAASAVKTEASEEEHKQHQIKHENTRIKAEEGATGVKKEEEEQEIKVKKQEKQETQEVAVVTAQEVKQAARDCKQNVKKDESQQQTEGDRPHIRRKAVTCAISLRASIEWAVAPGAEVDAGQRLGTVGRLEEGTQRRLEAPCRGRIYILNEQQREQLQDGKREANGNVKTTTVAFVEYCIHPVRNGRTCLMCLAVVDEEENEDMESVNVVSHGQVIRLNMEEAKKFDSDNIRRQLGAKKLSLVLDLDHTLLHAVRVDDVVSEINKTDDIYFFFIPGLAQQHVVKLRPGLTEFLLELSVLYDLFIYTHGTRLYAEQIVKIIDPDETFFKNRIVARTDTPDMLHKSLKLLFPSCDDSMILVLDDRIDVWKENEGNVFLIEPYHYFKCTSEINNASGRGVAGLDDSESEGSEDRHLAQTTTVLKHVHEVFYEGHASGMRGTTAEEQMAGNGRDVKAILSESVIIDVSGVPYWMQAKAISGVIIVTPDWLIKCARSWSRVSEQDFLADEWKAKHTKKEKQPVADVIPDADTHPEAVPSKESTDSSGDAANVPPPSTSSTSDETAVPGILLKRESGDEKKSKQVTFAKVIGDTGKLFETTVAQKSRVDVDDAFLRLIEAEERENQEEAKCKQSSTDIKDQLFSRRHGGVDNSKRDRESSIAESASGEKRMRVTPSVSVIEAEIGKDDGEENEEEEELDDLEADILGDL
ncbi:hypothetical protein BBJ29_003173 [Phytophthora kernoviae]|uniref:protein-serine/threonine phosphatase n=1 Tax=Phytophthora kernoviae TaxID=325452 RepID=A0A3R7KIL6_9STRA|nr:hypothetical protein BBJ29_003173 [Phytophthora kernoviae]